MTACFNNTAQTLSGPLCRLLISREMILGIAKLCSWALDFWSCEKAPVIHSIHQQHQPVRSMRSSNFILLTVPPAKTVTAARAFCISAQTVWNSLPYAVRETSSQPQFCTDLREIFLNASLVDHGYSAPPYRCRNWQRIYGAAYKSSDWLADGDVGRVNNCICIVFKCLMGAHCIVPVAPVIYLDQEKIQALTKKISKQNILMIYTLPI